MNYQVKHIEGKTGIEVSLTDGDVVVAAHFYEKEELDTDIKNILLQALQKTNY